MITTLHSRNSCLTATFLAAMLVVAVGGCGKKTDSARTPSPQSNAPPSTEAVATPPAEQMLVSWQQGDKAGAIQRFIETDWKRDPAFSPGSPLSHSESDLPAMSPPDRDKLMKEVMVQLKDLRALATAVREKGQAAAGTDPDMARRCFSRLDEFGAALDQPGGMKIVQLVGQAFRKMAAAETARLGK